MNFENFATEVQVRELMRRCLYLDASIYSNTKPLPFIPRPEWFTNSNADLQILLQPVERVEDMRRDGVSGVREFHPRIIYNGLQNKAVPYGNVYGQFDLIDTYGRLLKWSIDDAARWIYKAALPSWFSVNINIFYGEFLAGRWNSQRSEKVAAKFESFDRDAMDAKALEYRAKAALIVNENSARSTEYIQYARRLEGAGILWDDIETNNF